MQKKPKMSVPQFGGWEKKAPGVPTDYSMVFSQARANKKTQKEDLTEVKRLSVGNERPPSNANHHRINPRTHPQLHAHAHGHAHAHSHAHQDPPIMVSDTHELS